MLHKDFRDFLVLLAEHKVRHLVVGGYAVAVHGYPRYTGDLDVPFISYEDLVRNKAATGRGKDRVDIEELERRRKAKQA